jgi:deaminated glutathione amidase
MGRKLKGSSRATGEAHWHVLLRARAIETQSFVIAAAQAGQHNSARESFGHSLIISPWGTIIGALEDPLATGIAVADIDVDEADCVRSRMPIFDHRERAMPAVEGDIKHCSCDNDGQRIFK